MRRAFLLRVLCVVSLVVSGAAVARGDDHGGERATATPIAVDQAIAGVIDTAQDVDAFRFQASAGTVYRLEVAVNGLPAAALSLAVPGRAAVAGRESFEGSLGARLDWACAHSAEALVTLRAR